MKQNYEELLTNVAFHFNVRRHDLAVAMFAAIALVVSLGLPTKALPAAAAATGAGLLAAAAALIAPVLGRVWDKIFH